MTQPIRALLVLGAGSSMPYGFPSAAGLKSACIDCLEGNLRGKAFNDTRDILGHLEDAGFHRDDLQNFCKALALSPRKSVDAFLEQQPVYATVGKAVMAAILNPKEQAFFENPTPSKGQTHWYESLYIALGRNKDEIESLDFKVITFNYDRTFKGYLEHAYNADFGLQAATGIVSLKDVDVIHMYGSLGPHEYGDLVAAGPNAISKNELSVIPDERDTEGLQNKIDVLLAHADVVYFLGFGFDEANLSRLHLERSWPQHVRDKKYYRSTPPPVKNIWSTRVDITDHEISTIRDQIPVRILLRENTPTWDCARLLRNTPIIQDLRRSSWSGLSL